MKVKLLKDVYDDGQDHHPPGYVGRKGDTVVIHSIQTAVVSHAGTGNGFVVHDGELDLGSANAPETRGSDPRMDRLWEIHKIATQSRVLPEDVDRIARLSEGYAPAPKAGDAQ